MDIKNNLTHKVAVHLIRLYQSCFFLYRQYPHCKYFPSCSEYMLLAIQKHGMMRGIVLGVWRILRCHPLSHGGLDLP